MLLRTKSPPFRLIMQILSRHSRFCWNDDNKESRMRSAPAGASIGGRSAPRARRNPCTGLSRLQGAPTGASIGVGAHCVREEIPDRPVAPARRSYRCVYRGRSAPRARRNPCTGLSRLQGAPTGASIGVGAHCVREEIPDRPIAPARRSYRRVYWGRSAPRARRNTCTGLSHLQGTTTVFLLE
jgi:hypothetical protein